MILHVFLLLLLFVLVFSLTRLCSLHWPHHCPAQSAATARSTPIQRLLKPRSPNDCPACRLSSTPSSLAEPVPPAVRPWREVKSRRGVLPLLMVDNSTSPLRTHFELVFSSFDCTGGYFIPLAHTPVPAFTFTKLPSAISRHIFSLFSCSQVKHGTGGRGEQRTSLAVHRRLILPAAMAGIRYR